MLPLGRRNDPFDTGPDFIKSICAGKPCDWVVQEISQQGGLSNSYTSTFGRNKEGEAICPKEIPCINHGEEIGSIPIREKVRDLLLGGEEKFDPKGFPAVNSVEQPPTSLCMFPTKLVGKDCDSSKPVPAQKKSASQDIIKPESPKPIKSPNSEQQPIANEEQVRIALQSIQISVPDGWQKIQSGKKIAVVPDDGFKNGKITKGLIYGTLPNDGKPLTISQLESELLSMNPNLKAVTSESKGTLAGMEARGRSYKGFSTVTNTTEEVRIYVINLQNGISLYILIIAPETEVTSSNVLNQIVGSLKIK
jgi:hypothetical protein